MPTKLEQKEQLDLLSFDQGGLDNADLELIDTALSKLSLSTNPPEVEDRINKIRALLELKIEPKPVPEIAEAIEATEETETYAFARESSVPNAGEDFENSARHKVNNWRSLGEAEAEGTAESLVTRDNLLRNEPHKLNETITEDSAIVHYAAFLVLKAFPPNPYREREYEGYDKLLKRRKGCDPSRPDPKSPAQLRQEYYQTYEQLKTLLEEQVQMSNNPLSIVVDAGSFIVDRTRLLRQNDHYNPVGNEFSRYHKRLRIKSRYRPNDVYGKVNQLIKLQEDSSESAKAVVLELMAGKPLSKVLSGGSTTTKVRFKEEQNYSLDVTRAGGRTFSNPDQALLMDGFGLRGIQFGNSLPDKERKEHLKYVAEALADLADVTGLKDRQIALPDLEVGGMGLAIGARGKSNNLAHYEPKTHLTNLSRKRGNGALAHEWGHALDRSLLNNQSKDGNSCLLSQYVVGWVRKGNKPADMDQNLVQAMHEVLEAMESSGYNRRLREWLSEAAAKKLMSPDKRSYFYMVEERFARCFERYVQFVLAKEERCNTYLSGSNIHPVWATDEEIESIAPSLDHLLATYRALLSKSASPAGLSTFRQPAAIEN